ncbi:MAG: hypothetical protein K1X88_18390 [Nannocystaceae bacterium]|nr:hypothetical protein [Nannocystaceae bacterium]
MLRRAPILVLAWVTAVPCAPVRAAPAGDPMGPPRDVPVTREALDGPRDGMAVARSYDGPRAIPQAAAVEPAAPAEPTPPPTEPDEPDEVPAPELDEADGFDPLRDSPEAEVARKRIRGGILLLSAGVLLGTGAILMATSEPCHAFAGNGCQVAARRRASLTLGIPAGVIAIGGALLLGFGIRARRRIVADVALARGSAMVVLGGRF